MAITVGSVEVDVIPNTQGIYARLQAALVPAATRAGDDAGRAAGRAFGPAMQQQVGTLGLQLGQQIGQQIANRITVQVRSSLVQGVTQGGPAARAAATREGEEAGGAFGRTFRRRIEAAVRALPDITIGANTAEADADIRALREQLATLSRQRVGIDVDAATAHAQIDAVERDLRRLGLEHPDVAVRVNTRTAIAELTALRAELARMDATDVDIDVDTHTAAANFNLLTTAAIAFGPAILPVLPIAAAGLGAVAAAAVSAGVGFGVLAAVAAPAVAGIARALQAQKAAQDAVSTSTGNGAQKALQMAGAQQALASAQRNAASQIESAREQVAQAARGVGDAERQLADAQKESRQAQLDLVAARKEAAQQLEELASRYAGAQLSVRDAELSLREAQERRREVEADPKATLLDRQRAALAVDQATQRLKEQTATTKRLGEEQATAAKTGVEGTEVVKRAQDRLTKSQQTVSNRTRGVADAQAAVAKAQKNVAKVSAQAADSIASAQRSIASASASAASGVDQAAVAQAKYQAELAKLSPAARGTFNAFVGLRSAFSAWSLSLQPAVMPIFTRALEGLKNSLPGLTPIALAAASAVSGLQDRVSAGFKSPWWQTFKEDFAASVGPAVTGLGVTFGRLFKGMAGTIQAFLPHMDSISARMQAISGRFANWGTSLKGSTPFERFLSYSAQMGPLVADTVGKIATGFLDVGRALQPISGPLLKVIGALFEGVSWIATEFPGAIQLMYGIFIATRLWAGAVLLVNGAMWLATAAVAAFNFVMSLGPWGWIILAIVAVVAAVVFMYKKFDWFRNFVDGVWQGIVAGAQLVGRIAMWLWENAIKPAFEGIWLAARFLWAIVVVAVLTPLILWFKLVGAIAMWLWESTFKPAFEGIADAAVWLWEHALRPVFTWIGDKATALWREYISPAWESMKSGTRSLGDRFREFWDSYVKPVFNWIADKATWLYEIGIKPVFDRIKQAVGLVKDAFVWAKDGIKTAWDQLVDITRKPVRFIVETVYNGGIVPVWNAVAKIAGLGQLEKMKFASGGSVFGAGTATSDSIPALLSNGEHVWTAREVQAAGGHSVVESLRQRALRSGSTFAAGGAVGIPRFAEGGVVDWFSGKAQKIGSAVMTGIDFLSNPGKGWDLATKALREKINEKLTGNQWAQALSQLPLAMLKSLKARIVTAADDLIGGGSASGSVAAAVGFARSQAGKPYQWGGAGNPSWDCSGFMSGIQKVILGQSPLGRLWSTFSFQGDTAPAGWRRNLRSPFMVGITNNGVGHTAGTLAGMNVESRGGDGVIVGSRARGYNNSLFQDWYGFAPALGKFDSGGYLQPGMNLAYNGTGRPEPVFTTGQANALTSMAARGTQSGPARFEGDLYLDSGEFLGRVRGEAAQIVDGRFTELTSALNGGPRRI
ncbi:hypothetical protein [Streptomyces sp. NBC_01565]|uniref:hypothetical protein n=1 Tax=Streptomyces sp. NBC_01565 TaxID=2975881 RepID=UPI00224FEEAF|nr:hypothetical protein [Streptomyces sp. NBC_01565]MCX4541457.1 hypothetical protein [Streptomyces sp. NBC_01565]